MSGILGNLDTSIDSLSEEDLNIALGDVDDSGKTTKKKTDDKNKKSSKTDDKKSKKTSSKDTSAIKNISNLSKDDAKNALDDDDDDDTNDDQDDDKDDKDDNDDDSPLDVDDDKDDDSKDDDDDNDQDDDKDDDDKDENKDDDEDKDDDEVEEDDASFLKARVDLLIKKGEWQDWEGREDTKWDNETFAEVELQQQEFKRSQMREELLDGFGAYGRQIAEFSENGGDPDELIEIFKQTQQVGSLLVDNEDNQRKVVFKYETEFLGKKPERVNKYIDSLIADKDLEGAAKEAKEAMEESLEQESNRIQEEQKQIIKQQIQQRDQSLQKFSKDVINVVNARKDIPSNEKQEVIKVLTKFNRKLKNGTPVNDFYFVFSEFRKDINNYVDLVRHVLNPKGYTKALVTKGKNDATEKDFNFIRTSNKKKVKSQDSSSDPDKTKKKPSTFKLL